MKPNLLLFQGVSLAVLALVLLIGTADTVQAGTFNPVLSVCYDDAGTPDPRPFEPGDPEECDGDNSAGAHSDFTVDFRLPEGDVQFAGLVAFIPNEYEIIPGDEIPIGTIVGSLTSQATLGLINGACNNALPVQFTFLNSSIDPSDTVPFVDSDDNGDPDFTEDKDDSGLPDAFEKYPEFITRVLVDEDGQPQHPIRRSAGITVVAGIKVLLQFLIFEPGTFIDELISNDEELGFPSVTLLQNVGDPDADPVPGAITDFCSPLISSNITFGISKDNPCTDAVSVETLDPLCAVTGAPLEITDEGTTDPDESGIVLLTNPQEGTYTFTIITAGARDAEGDGIENTLDTCAFTPNEGDPRIQGDGDLDGDGLDAACDPNDDPLTGGTNSDEDLDGYLNRQDNCPLDPNGEELDNQKDTDSDGIGDACDPNPDDAEPQGEQPIVVVTSDLTVGAGGPATQETPAADETPTGDETPAADDDDGGSGTIIVIIIVVIIAVVVVGGGAFYFMRRGGGTPGGGSPV